MTDDFEQWSDDIKLQFQLEEALNDAEQGVRLSTDQIDTLRYGCGLPAKPRKSEAGQQIWNMLIDMNQVMAESLKEKTNDY